MKDTHFHLGHQPFVSEPLAGGCGYKTLKPLKGVPLAVPGVQAKGELIDISPQVLRAGMVVNAVDSTFQGGPYAVDADRYLVHCQN